MTYNKHKRIFLSTILWIKISFLSSPCTARRADNAPTGTRAIALKPVLFHCGAKQALRGGVRVCSTFELEADLVPKIYRAPKTSSTHVMAAIMAGKPRVVVTSSTT
jgi:hypothetical protein